MTSAEFGWALRIILHQWVTGCPPLPEADIDLQGIARANSTRGFSAAKERIRELVADLRPHLEQQLRLAEKRRLATRALRARNAANQQAAALTREMEDRNKLTLADFIPRKANPRPRFAPRPGVKLWAP